MAKRKKRRVRRSSNDSTTTAEESSGSHGRDFDGHRASALAQDPCLVHAGNTLAGQAALEAAYPDVAFVWLTFEHGGQGVFLLTAGELKGVG